MLSEEKSLCFFCFEWEVYMGSRTVRKYHRDMFTGLVEEAKSRARSLFGLDAGRGTVLDIIIAITNRYFMHVSW